MRSYVKSPGEFSLDPFYLVDKIGNLSRQMIVTDASDQHNSHTAAFW